MNTNDITNNCTSCVGCGCSQCTGNRSGKLETYDYLYDIPETATTTVKESDKYVEVSFKNTRKGFYINSLNLPLEKGDLVAVEANPGHDIGTVSLTGKLVQIQMRNKRIKTDNPPLKVFRKAKPNDLERYKEAKSKEQWTMIRSRQIAKSLGLDMKIGDVEYQGDGLKAIFYYIADRRVDFRQLIRELANEFRIKVEMRQIGARQEAGLIGGIGPCGRQLCCSGWMTNFRSVSTNAARIQDISPNPQKLAGQCAKLKCCLNYEVNTYYEAQGLLPNKNTELRTQNGTYRHYKADILAQQITYVPIDSPRSMDEAVVISTDRAMEIIDMNNRGEEPYSLLSNTEDLHPLSLRKESKDILVDSSLTRFDAPKKEQRSKRRKRNNRKKQAQGRQNQEKEAEQNQGSKKVIKGTAERSQQRTRKKGGRSQKRNQDQEAQPKQRPDNPTK